MTQPARLSWWCLRITLSACVAFSFVSSFSLSATAGDKDEKKEKPKAATEKKQGAKPAAKAKSKLETQVFEVGPDFLKDDARGGNGAPDPFAPNDAASANPGVNSAQRILEHAGITFGAGASASYDAATYHLKVTNTAEQLGLVAVYVSMLTDNRERQIHIVFELIEVEHAAFSDWLFDHRMNSDGTPLRNWAQELINDKKAGIFESAMVTARSGQRAKVESVYEYIYPTEYNPPDIPNEVSLKGKAEAPVTGVNATAFETRNVGTTFEVDPVIGADNYTIDLNLAPEVVALDGSNIWPNKDVEARFRQEMPIFYSMRVTTQVTLTDGGYAFLGTVRPREASVKGVEDPICLAFVRADIGVVPWPKPPGKEEKN